MFPVTLYLAVCPAQVSTSERLLAATCESASHGLDRDVRIEVKKTGVHGVGVLNVAL